ncbi:hypothetical protein ATANTOWER_018956 [Ataeniobius toweri]|uniref:Ig-like domain-containing protein n=1 Tax=Ataeniobius toweri TaxID=208326 RepID=A0ABU7BTL4_9TELE|nr:hypothetical protein [Ataeniobius toweri]
MEDFICLLFLQMTLMFFSGSLCQDQENIKAQSGDNVNLICRASDTNPVTVVRLSRPDLSPEYALFYRNDKIDEQNQNPRFKGRTNLQRTNIADGKVSLTLNNVTKEDTGTYVCRVKTETNGVNKRRKRAITQTVIQLNVAPPPSGNKDGNKEGGVNERGHIGLVVGVMVTLSVLILTASAVFVWKRKRNSSPPHPPHNEAEQPLQV